MGKTEKARKAESRRARVAATRAELAAENSLAAIASESQPSLFAIERERRRLMKAESLLSCVLAAMEQDEHVVEGVYYPDVIEQARELLNAAIDKLDSMHMRPLLVAQKSKRKVRYPPGEEGLRFTSKRQIRESESALRWGSTGLELAIRLQAAAFMEERA